MYIEKKYFSLDEVMDRWKIEERDIGYLAENDELRLSIRIYEVCLELGRPVESSTPVRWVWEESERYSGLVDLRAVDAFSLFRCAESRLIEFRNTNGDRLRIPGKRRAVHVMLGDLLVRREERDRIEQSLGFDSAGLQTGRNPSSNPPDFRRVTRNGTQFQLGEVQAHVVRELHRAAQAGEPWQPGKRILTQAGAKSLRMADVFKSQPGWRDLIESNGRGHYRLRPDLDPPA